MTPPAVPSSAEAAYELVLTQAGASKVRDAADQRVIAGVKDRTHRRIDSQKEVGGWPQLESGTTPADSDNDGMPDAWETQHDLDPANHADGAAGAQGDADTWAGALSGDGQHVAFSTDATNFGAVAGRQYGNLVFVRNLATGTTRLASRGDGAAGALERVGFHQVRERNGSGAAFGEQVRIGLGPGGDGAGM